MTESASDGAQTVSIRWGVLVAGLVLLAVLLFSPIKGWLNRIPYLWHVVYPLLTIFAAALVAHAVATQEGLLTIVKWMLLLIGTAGAAIHTYGGARIFFTVGRWAALLFVAVEVLHTISEGLSGDGEARTTA
ncbi:MAG: hypothetical protein ACP5HG_11505 [Anaerolineae bacterium]